MLCTQICPDGCAIRTLKARPSIMLNHPSWRLFRAKLKVKLRFLSRRTQLTPTERRTLLHLGHYATGSAAAT